MKVVPISFWQSGQGRQQSQPLFLPNSRFLLESSSVSASRSNFTLRSGLGLSSEPMRESNLSLSSARLELSSNPVPSAITSYRLPRFVIESSNSPTSDFYARLKDSAGGESSTVASAIALYTLRDRITLESSNSPTSDFFVRLKDSTGAESRAVPSNELKLSSSKLMLESSSI